MFSMTGWYELINRLMTPWQWGLVIAAVALTIWLIGWLRAHFREDADDADETIEMLTQFRELHQEGGLSDDEFRLIRSRLAHSAREACVTKQTQRTSMAVERKSSASTDSQIDTSSASPATHVTAENEAKSERNTDELTD